MDLRARTSRTLPRRYQEPFPQGAKARGMGCIGGLNQSPRVIHYADFSIQFLWLSHVLGRRDSTHVALETNSR
jgi:hypothetical protein